MDKMTWVKSYEWDDNGENQYGLDGSILISVGVRRQNSEINMEEMKDVK
jgi:hypothetical protein